MRNIRKFKTDLDEPSTPFTNCVQDKVERLRWMLYSLRMATAYEELIRQEQAKIDVLQRKIAECKRRIEALQSMAQSDDLDTFLSQSLGKENQTKVSSENDAPSHEPASEGSEGESPSLEQEFKYPKRRLDHNVLIQLNFIGPEGKNLDELFQFSVKEKGFHKKRESLRTFLSNYKTKYGFLSQPEPGFFRLTERGIRYLEEHFQEPESEAPSDWSSEGASYHQTELPHEGGNDSDGLV